MNCRLKLCFSCGFCACRLMRKHVKLKRKKKRNGRKKRRQIRKKKKKRKRKKRRRRRKKKRYVFIFDIFRVTYVALTVAFIPN